MGYLTNHGLTIVKGNEELIAELRRECADAKDAFDDDGNVIESVKWYAHEEDIKRFSLKHPEAVFLLEGEGEEPGDLWRTYFKNGKIQTCPAHISFDDFDEAKLL